jgi:hypothetical protein
MIMKPAEINVISALDRRNITGIVSDLVTSEFSCHFSWESLIARHMGLFGSTTTTGRESVFRGAVNVAFDDDDEQA